jgi:hypothetical protein
MDHELRSTLVQLQLPLAEPPAKVVELLQHACRPPAVLRKATPQAVRQHLVTLGTGWEAGLTDAQCHHLLLYFLSDLRVEALSDVSEAGAAQMEKAQRICAEVKQLPLLPLRDGSRTSFTSATSRLVLCTADDECLRPTPALVVAHLRPRLPADGAHRRRCV